ncbi:MAG: M23 family metallopeptidase [Deltaproteobacteria bacterium]|nr:M23 family metallopeptidase [Deltaproteobacteria bacterium]
MAKKKKAILTLALIPILLIAFGIGWFLTVIFEGEKPEVNVPPLPEFLSKEESFSLELLDRKRGLKEVAVTLAQEGREVVIHREKFPFKGLLNRKGTHQLRKDLSIDPLGLNLAQGRVDLVVKAWDYSRRGGGDGNLSLLRRKMVVDTIPPALRSLSRMHNVNMGGAGLVVYQTSSDALESGLMLNDFFFPGFAARERAEEGVHVVYFSMPRRLDSEPSLLLRAKDRAGNLSKSGFYYHIRKRKFRHEIINITDRFLKKVLPFFSNYPFNPEDSDIKRYIVINNELRKQNHKTLFDLRDKTSPERMWEGPFLRLKNAATMARFGDRRSYYYKREKVDEQTHLGVDLASLASSPVPAANHGRVIFAGELGIYGNTVVLDHGQGLMSLYGHLSKTEVTLEQSVRKGDIIGYTGQTGLAGGDHLHFGIMVNGTFVNPIEWWDNHWIQDNIERKLALLKTN